LISLAKWPIVDEFKIDDKLEKIEETIDRTVSDIMNILKIVEDRGEKPKKVYVYVTQMEIEYFDEKKMSSRVGKLTKVFAVNNPNKYDPKDISKKSKFGKPGIFVE